MRKALIRINRILVLTVAVVALVGIVFARGVRQDGPGWFDVLMGKWNEIVELPPKINVLLVGVDKRVNWEAEHCDAIHLMKFDLVDERVEIVNVPRGTPTRMEMPAGWEPKKELVDAVMEEERIKEEAGITESGNQGIRSEDDKTKVEIITEEIATRAWGMEQYVSNICYYAGFEPFVREIEKITKEKIDYTARIGFSEAEGILRVLKFNPASTLQFLRHRQSFSLGDVQRSYNQAVFIGDMLSGRISDVGKLPTVLQFTLFRLLKTDMPPEVAHTLFKEISQSKIVGDRTRITHKTMPALFGNPEVIHIDPEDVRLEVDRLYGHLTRLLPSFNVKDTEMTIKGYVENAEREASAAWLDGDTEQARAIMNTVVSNELWHQIENDKERIRLMVEVTKIWSAMEWNRTNNRDIALELPLRVFGYLSLESDDDVAVNDLRLFLERLLTD
ncbi:MAG: hypothetical protein AAB886_00265 [Patescibacteria group bacterium]